MHRIVLNISPDPLELSRIPNQTVVTLILPKRTRSPQHLIRSQSGEAFERSRNLENRRLWTHQHVDMIRHNRERVQRVASQYVGMVMK